MVVKSTSLLLQPTGCRLGSESLGEISLITTLHLLLLCATGVGGDAQWAGEERKCLFLFPVLLLNE